jgi:glycosyltransferase involved in cell wall biosynthesis
VEKSGLQTQFHLLGSRNDVAALLANAEIKVFPSTGESFPNAPLEAMAARLPVIASRVGGVPEMVEEGATGMLIPPGDSDALAGAILWMLAHP